MQKVNYIAHLNRIFEIFHDDPRIKQGHITLYFAFFQKWNSLFFQKTLTINRAQIMERAKIRSKTTYHNYLQDLNNWGFLKYYPSYHPKRGSRIQMTFELSHICTSNGTSNVQNLDSSVTEPVQNLASYYKLKRKENLKKRAGSNFNEFEVLLFFKKNNWPEIEGKKFYAYNRSKKFILKDGKTKMNWQTAANNFFKNGFKITNGKQTSPISGYLDNLNKKRNSKRD